MESIYEYEQSEFENVLTHGKNPVRNIDHI